VPVAAALVWTDVEARQAHEHVDAARAQTARQAAPFKPKFFTAHEYATVGALVDRLATDRFGKRFVACADRERRQLLDEIAYTSNPDRGLSHAIAFFSSFRDLTAS
jgi:phage terminase large subunit GpA-like protein